MYWFHFDIALTFKGFEVHTKTIFERVLWFDCYPIISFMIFLIETYLIWHASLNVFHVWYRSRLMVHTHWLSLRFEINESWLQPGISCIKIQRYFEDSSWTSDFNDLTKASLDHPTIWEGNLLCSRKAYFVNIFYFIFVW